MQSIRFECIIKSLFLPQDGPNEKLLVFRMLASFAGTDFQTLDFQTKAGLREIRRCFKAEKKNKKEGVIWHNNNNNNNNNIFQKRA